MSADSPSPSTDLGAGRIGHLIVNTAEAVFQPPLRRITNLSTSSGDIEIVEASGFDYSTGVNSRAASVVLPDIPAGGSIDHDVVKILNANTTVPTGKIFAQQ